VLKNNVYVSLKVDQCNNQNDKASHLVAKNLAWNIIAIHGCRDC